jgi:hypothetical protein
MQKPTFWLVLAAMQLALLCCGCGAAAAAASAAAASQQSATISSAQITAGTVEMAQAFSVAAGNFNASSCSNAFANNYYCAAFISTTGNCAGGGSGSLTGDVSAYWSYYATGPASGPLTFIPTNCPIPNSSLIIEGSSNVIGSGTITFFYGTPTNLSASESGGFAYGPNPSGLCPVSLTITASYNTAPKTCTVTGTACGQTINASCE